MKTGGGIFSRDFLRSDVAVVLYLALAKLVLHFLTNGQYGYFRDELYFLACGERLDWGYVDQPPLIAVAARVTRALFGDSLFAIRLFPAIAGALLVLLTGLIARELGGGRFAQVLACVAVIIAPGYLLLHTWLTMNAFEPLLWMLCAYLLILILKGGDEKLWLLFGATAGVGLLNKHSMLFFGSGLVAGLVLAGQGRRLLSKWALLGGLLAFVIFLPNVWWQWARGWPMLELLRNVEVTKNYQASLAEFFAGQLLLTHPLNFPLWLAGLYFYLRAETGKKFRALGWSYLIVYALMIFLKGKVYYLAPIYPMLLAAGGVWFEGALAARPRLVWARAALIVVLLAGGAALAPLVLPVLPVETFIRYARTFGMQEGVKTENQKLGRLPQHYADMFGWENMTATVARVFHNLPPEEQMKCAIYTQNYGEAGAIDFFGRAYGLPKAISGHQNYFLWGPRGHTGECVIIIGGKAQDHAKIFGEVREAARVWSDYAMPYETDLPIYVCRQPKLSLQEVWPQVKHYD